MKLIAYIIGVLILLAVFTTGAVVPITFAWLCDCMPAHRGFGLALLVSSAFACGCFALFLAAEILKRYEAQNGEL